MILMISVIVCISTIFILLYLNYIARIMYSTSLYIELYISSFSLVNIFFGEFLKFCITFLKFFVFCILSDFWQYFSHLVCFFEIDEMPIFFCYWNFLVCFAILTIFVLTTMAISTSTKSINDFELFECWCSNLLHIK